MPTAARPAHPHSQPNAGAQAPSKPKLYNPRHPERTLLYRTIAEHFETWHALASCGQFDGQGDHHTPRSYVRQAFRKYLECGIFLRVIEQSLAAHCPGAANVDKAALHIGAVAVIHRFGSSLNPHVHFHVCVVDGVFQMVPGEFDATATPPGVIFHPTSGIDEAAVVQVQADLRRRILRAFVGCGLIERVDAKEMLAYEHSGFSVDVGVCIKAHDRAALERLLCYCARPPFAMDRLRKEGAALAYRCAKQHREPGGDKRGAKVDMLHLTPLELIDRIAALVPPPRTHRHRYFGVLAPNSPLRAAVTALAASAQQAKAQAEPVITGEGAPTVAPLGNAVPPTPDPAPPKRSPAHYLWAALIARFPGACGTDRSYAKRTSSVLN